jgi:two-component system, cell cycle response regulator
MSSGKPRSPRPRRRSSRRTEKSVPAPPPPAERVHRETVVQFPIGPAEIAPEESNIILISHPEGKMIGTRYRLSPAAALEIGRASSSDIAFPEVPSLSRTHARLEYRGKSVALIDLGSTNGTFVNDKRVRTSKILHSGDRFQAGVLHFKFLQGRDVEHHYHEAIHDLAMRDGLTEVFNKRKFDKELEREFARAKRYERELSLILLDLDHFKAVNDTYGHIAGDFVLKELSTRISAVIRAEQIFARIGGEEFGVICPESGTQKAGLLAEKLRDIVSREKLRASGSSISITCSFGVAAFSSKMTTAPDLFAVADKALYLSKRRGRNRVSIASTRPPE